VKESPDDLVRRFEERQALKLERTVAREVEAMDRELAEVLERADKIPARGARRRQEREREEEHR
jgi:hypothetical protein